MKEMPVVVDIPSTFPTNVSCRELYCRVAGWGTYVGQGESHNNIDPAPRPQPSFLLLSTYVLANCMGLAPFRWKTPSTKTPFFPLHVR